MTTRAFIAGCSGLELTPDEAAFFRDAEPWGFILFRRNIETPGAGDGADCAACARRVGARRADPDRPGGRPGPAHGTAALAELSAGPRLWPACTATTRWSGARSPASAPG